jgi:hypothetical protein
VQRDFSKHNTRLATQQAAAEIGLDPNTATLNLKTLLDQKDALAAPYREVEAMGGNFKKAWDKIQNERGLWKQALRQMSSAELPADRAKFKASAEKHLAAAESTERALDAMVQKTGNPGLAKELVDSRKMLAKYYVVEAATNTDAGFVEPAIIAAIHDSNPRLLTGNLRTIGATANLFPEVMSGYSKFSKPSQNPPRTAFISGAGLAAYGATQSVPVGVAAALAAYSVDVPARAIAKHRWTQAVLAHPSYNLIDPVKTAEFFRYAINAAGRNEEEFTGERAPPRR